jgi:hypothetical protein
MGFEVYKSSLDEMSSLAFPTGFRQNHIGEQHLYWRDIYKISLRPSLSSTGSLAELLIPMRRNKEIFARPSNMYCLFTETHRSEFENLLVFECINRDLEQISKNIVSPVCFHLNRGKNGKCDASSENLRGS